MRTVPLLLLALLFAACDGPAKQDTAVTDDVDGDGVTSEAGDCDDNNVAAYPGADEIPYDGIDEDCDGITDDTDVDGDGVAVGDDCDDGDPAVNPDATEVCNGVDDDCDGDVDTGAVDGSLAYLDADGDGDGDPDHSVTFCDTVPEGYAVVGDDCDDSEATVFPGAAEICDDLDNDCDGTVNEGHPEEVRYYRDADGDGYGDATASTMSCETPEGFSADATDCNDAVSAVHPGAEEYCDATDRDCDGDPVNDPVDGDPYYTDADGDGFGDPATAFLSCSPVDGLVADATDCDDADPLTYAGAAEVCDLLDNDCDGVADDGATDARTWYLDADADGHGDASVTLAECGLPSGYSATDDDCDDADPLVSPGAAETCNTVDDDCDGDTDEDAVDATAWYADADGDAFGDPTAVAYACSIPAAYLADGTDCDDTDAAINPLGTEVCGGADEDCDGEIDEDSAADAATWYLDADADGYGDALSTTPGCTQPAGYEPTSDDCDDADAGVNPGATESCDGIDDDCDGALDEAGATGETTWYVDADGDGHGATSPTLDACDLPTGYAALADDCDDADATSYPAGTELDDGADNDCDGWVDEDFVAVGDIVVSEIDRQPRIGSASTVTDAQWFELYNTSSRDIDLSNWYITRASSTVARVGIYVDPDEHVVIAAGGYAVFCKSDDYTAAATSASELVCDYVLGDPTEAATWAGTAHANTFTLQRDDDTLGVYLGGSATTGTAIDTVHWTYDAVNGYWPRDARSSLSLDPAALDAVSDDALTAWCSSPASSAYTWYDAGGTALEYGTPGSANYDCP
jgi:hypothetical protein